jgi:tRNA pseudouridine55 synthase
VDGILNIDKPRGKTSFQVVAWVRRLSSERRVGHGGTLDPEATGVLPVSLGKGTRLLEYLIDARKTYRAVVMLGAATDTYDASGRITSQCDPLLISPSDIKSAVASFTGIVHQTPPMYSAIKSKGVPLYRFARAGIEVSREAREVEFFRIDVVACAVPEFTVEVECSKGAYIRSLAHDVGQKLEVGAHLKTLVRTRSGPFRIEDAIEMPEVDAACRDGRLHEIVLPIDVAVAHLPSVRVDKADEEAIVNGRPPDLTAWQGPGEGQCRAYAEDGRLIAILRRDDDKSCWRPRKVLVRSAREP